MRPQIVKKNLAMLAITALVLISGSVFPALAASAEISDVDNDGIRDDADTCPNDPTNTCANPEDTTAPEITVVVTCDLEGNLGWCRDDVTVQWTVIDHQSTITSTSGCETTTISSDVEEKILTCTATSQGGVYSLSAVVNVDKTAPITSSGTQSPEANENGWNNGDVSVEFTCSDALSDCTPPTPGVNAEGRRIVTNGFTYNGQSIDAKLFFTPYPLITTEVGKENVAKLKIYENTGVNNLRHVELIFGLKKGGENLSEPKVSIVWEKDWQLNESFYVVDPENKLDKDSLSIDSEEVLCTTAANNDWCTELTITHTFKEAPEFDAVGVRTWDANNYSWDYTFNHGVHVTGDSLNPADELYIASPDRHIRGLMHVIEVDSVNNIWQADNGYLYQMNDYGTFILISDVKVDKVTDTGEPRKRNHSGFSSLKESEAERAKSVWDSQKIISELGPSFVYDYPIEDSRTKFLREHNLLDWVKGN